MCVLECNHRSCYLHGCPCGYNGDPVKECTCSSTMISRYQKKISGPLLDRIDIHVEVPRVEYEKLSDKRLGEPSSAIRLTHPTTAASANCLSDACTLVFAHSGIWRSSIF